MMDSYQLTELKFLLKQTWRRWAKPLAQCLVASLVTVGTVALWLRDEGQRLDLWVLHQFFEFRGPRQPPQEIVIVAIDDESYQKLDASTRWPFPRRFVAEALERIVSAGPKALIIDAYIPKESDDPASNERIANALRIGPTTIWSGATPTGEHDTAGEQTFVKLSSDRQFSEAAKMELPMLIGENQGQIWRLTLNGRDDATLFDRVPLARPLVELAKIDIPLPGPVDLINFYGPRGTINRIPIYRLIGPDGDALRAELAGKIVFAGYQSVARGRGQMDKEEYYVPVSDDPMFGMEIHANVAGNLVDRSWLMRFPLETELSIIFLSALLISAAAVAISPEKGGLLVAGFLGAASCVCYLAFAKYHFWIPGLGVALAAGVFAVSGSAFYHYVVIRNFRKYVRKTFNFDFEREL